MKRWDNPNLRYSYHAYAWLYDYVRCLLHVLYIAYIHVDMAGEMGHVHVRRLDVSCTRCGLPSTI